MTELPASLVPALGNALAQFLWQGTLVGLLAWPVLRLLESARPQVRYAVACLAMLACALLPLWQLLLHVGHDTAVVASAPIPLTAHGATGANASPAFAITSWAPAAAMTRPWIVPLWAIGAGALSLRMLFGLHWIGHLRRSSRESGQEWQARLDRLARRFGLPRPVGLRLVAAGESPVAIGIWRPLVLLPATLLTRMPADLIEALLAHELAHIRRHDYLVNLLQSVVETLLFYHPVVWWLSHRIRIEREQVADDLAARILGEPRRLAIALSELDRLSLPPPRFAQGAHGGQLMSRIQQLIRPRHQAIGSRIVVPLLGLVAASFAIYAHAQIARHGTATAAPTAPVAAPAPATRVTPAVAPAPAAQAAPAIAANPTPSTVTAHDAVAAPRTMHRHGRMGDSYALVRLGQPSVTMAGNEKDMRAIDDARKHVDGDFLWFRRNGKDYVIRDPALLARVQEEWQSTKPYEARMQALERQMQSHDAELQAMSRRMAAMDTKSVETPTMLATEKKIQDLAMKQQAVASQQQERAQAMATASDAQRETLEREMKALDQERAALDRQMKTLSESLEASTRTLEANREPMEALGRQMEMASKPLEALGKQMEALGRQQERAANQADASTRRLIQEALDKGLATPEPGAMQAR